MFTYSDPKNQKNASGVERVILSLPSLMDIAVVLTIVTALAFIWILIPQEPFNPFAYTLGGRFREALSLQFGYYAAFWAEVLYVFRGVVPYIVISIACGTFFYNLKKDYLRYEPQDYMEQEPVFGNHLRKLSEDLNVKKIPVIKTIKSPIKNPWVIWFGRYYMILPEGFLETYSSSDLETEAVLYHELAHIKNRDPLKTSVVEALSFGYILTNASLAVFQMLGALPLWQFARTMTIDNLVNSTLLLLSVIFLATLNRIAVRQREFHADRTAAFVQGNSIHLRKALVRFSSGIDYHNEHTFSFIGLTKKSNLYEKIFRYHPPITERNRFLFNKEKQLFPSVGFIFAIGFSTTLTVETGLRAMRINPTGTGIWPLLSVLTEHALSVFILSAVTLPIFTYLIHHKKKIFVIELLNSFLLFILFFCLGAMFGYFFSVIPLAKELFQIQSPWAVVSSSIGDLPRDVLISITIVYFLAFSQIEHIENYGDKPVLWTYFLLPNLLGIVPIVSWYGFYAFSYAEINAGGIMARSAQIAIGFSLAYIGLLIGLFGKRVDLSRLDIFIWDSGHFTGILFPYKKFIRSPLFFLLLVASWVLIYKMAMNFRLYNATYQNFLSQSINSPSEEVPLSEYSQFSGDDFRVIFSFPDGWVIRKVEEDGMSSRLFYNPSSSQILAINDIQSLSHITIPERFFLLERILLGTDEGKLFQSAQPISTNTKIGIISGLWSEIELPSGQVMQLAILGDGPVSNTRNLAAYEIIVTSSQQDSQNNQEILLEVVNSFDFQNVASGEQIEYAEMNLYQDTQSGFEFNYPFTWNIDAIFTNGEEITLRLPEDSEGALTQIHLSLGESRNRVVVNYQSTAQFINPSERINRWIKFQSEINQNTNRFALIDRSSPELGPFPANQIIFEMTFHSGIELLGVITVMSDEQRTVDIIMLCELFDSSDCMSMNQNLIRSLKLQ